MVNHMYFKQLIINLVFTCALVPFGLVFSDSEPQQVDETITEEKVFKVSEESIASLVAHLSEEKFSALKKLLLDKEYNPETMALIEQLKQQQFSDEELERSHKSIQFYFEILEKINQIAPLVFSLNEVKKEISKKEKSLDSLMNQEKQEVENKIKELEKQLEAYQNSFKIVVQELGLDDINFDKLPGMLADLGYEESFYQVIYDQLSAYLSVAKKLQAAASIIKSLDKVSEDIRLIERELKKAKTDEQKAFFAADLKNLIDRKKVLTQDFTLNSTGIDQGNIKEKKDEKINWEDELKKIFSPVIINLKEFTEPARKIELLHTDIAYYEQYLPKIQKGIEQLEMLLSESRNRQIKQKLTIELEYWVQQEKELRTKYEVAKQQLVELESRKVSPQQAIEALTNTIFSKQGKNILLAILAFFVTFLVLHLLRRILLLINPLNYIPRFKFIASLIDVILYLLTFIISILVLMVALYMAGSMMTLAIVAFILVGVLWALRNALPHFVEQIKLLLGYGPVRQGEKVIYDGIQWLVESIGVYSYLRNPLLTSNVVRLPLKDLIHMRSRPYDEREKLFPCQEGDYILINHKDWRRVTTQTPERMTLEWFEMQESMPTSTFLQQKVFNISATPFWVGTNLYIAYEHRYQVMEEIVEQLGEFLEQEFKKLPFGEHLLYPWVDFSEMTDLSLGVMAWVQVAPEAAPKYNNVRLRLTQICLKAANHYGWQVLRFHAIHKHQPHDPFNDTVNDSTQQALPLSEGLELNKD